MNNTGLSCAAINSHARLCKSCHRRPRARVIRMGHPKFLKVCAVCQKRLAANANASTRKPKRSYSSSLSRHAGVECYAVTGPAARVLSSMNRTGGW